jgi:hypothetical protein
MALTFPSSPSSGDTYTDDNQAVWRFDGVKWDIITSTTKKLFSGARVELGSNFSLTDTLTAISGGIDAVVPFDTDNYFRQAYPARIYAPTNGFYRVFIALTASNIGNGTSYTLVVKRNGSQQLSNDVFGANQTAVYDEILELNAEDYIEVYASDSENSGYIAEGSHIEISRLGLSIGSGISAFDVFSGVKVNLTTAWSVTSTSTAVGWDATEFDQNADVLGSTYWSSLDDTKLTVKVTGYYRLRCYTKTNASGTENSYTLSVKKNGTTVVETINMSANDFVFFNDILQLTANDYLELYVSNTGNVGQLTTDTYLELSRSGV